MSDIEIEKLIEKARAKCTAGKYKNVLSIVKKIEEKQPSKEYAKEYLSLQGLALFKLKKYYEAIIISSGLFIKVPPKMELLEELKEMLSHVEIHNLLVKNIFTGSRRNEIIRDLIEGLADPITKGKLLMLLYVSSGDPRCEGMAYIVSELDRILPYGNKFLEKEKAQIILYSLRAGSEYTKRQNFRKAISEFNKVLYINPKHVNALTLKGLGHFNRNEYKEAKKSMTLLLKIEPENVMAIKYLNILEKEPEYRKEVVLSEEERIDKSLDPDSRRLNDKGADLLSLGKLDQALLIFQEALTIDPNNFRAILNIGQVYKIQGQMEMATESCDKALEIIPDYLDALIVKASILMYKKEYDNALELYDQILGINPNHSKSKFSKGIIYEATEQFDKALKIYEGILKDNPNNWEAQKLRDRAKLELKGLKGEEMLQALEKVNEEYLITEKGFQFLKEGRFQEAIESFNKAIEINPGYYLSWAHKGFVLMDLGRYEEAISASRKALELNPSDLYARNNLGSSLRTIGNAKEAIQQLKKSISLNSQQFVAWYNLGNAHMDQKNYLEAVYCYDRAIAIDPSKINARNNKRIAEKNLAKGSEHSALIRISGPDKNGLFGTPESEGDGEYKLIRGKNSEDLAGKIHAESMRFNLMQMADVLPDSLFGGILEGDTFMEELKKERDSRKASANISKEPSLYSIEQIQFKEIDFPPKLQELIEKNDWKESLHTCFEKLKKYSVSQLILLQAVIDSNKKSVPHLSHFNQIIEHYALLINGKPYGRNNQKRFVQEILRNLRKFRVEGIIQFDYNESRRISGRVTFATFPIHIFAIILKFLLKKRPSE